jgi:hypothetical protein
MLLSAIRTGSIRGPNPVTVNKAVLLRILRGHWTDLYLHIACALHIPIGHAALLLYMEQCNACKLHATLSSVVHPIIRNYVISEVEEAFLN